jgi:DnaD/phage-associated family protein
MKRFTGFTNSESFTAVPDSFFRQLLHEIEDMDEFKVTAYALWRFVNIEGPFPALVEEDFDPADLSLDAEAVRQGLDRAVERGSLIRAERDSEVLFFLNSPRGVAAARAFVRGQAGRPHGVSTAPLERPEIFRLYEENIGPLTPLIADALKDAEQTFSTKWVAEAIEIAVKNNKRSWRYCEAILKRWKEEGRAEKQNRRDAEDDRHKYVKGEFADHIEH